MVCQPSAELAPVRHVKQTSNPTPITALTCGLRADDNVKIIIPLSEYGQTSINESCNTFKKHAMVINPELQCVCVQQRQSRRLLAIKKTVAQKFTCCVHSLLFGTCAVCTLFCLGPCLYGLVPWICFRRSTLGGKKCTENIYSKSGFGSADCFPSASSETCSALLYGEWLSLTSLHHKEQRLFVESNGLAFSVAYIFWSPTL